MAIFSYAASLFFVVMWLALGGSDGDVELMIILAMYFSLMGAITEVRDRLGE